jgi:hypothetical protein
MTTRKELLIMTNENKESESEKRPRDLYPINESLLQSYRRIFISTESFLLGVAVFASDKKLLVFIPIVAAGLIIIFLGWLDCLGVAGRLRIKWCGVIIARARIVDYYKYEMNKESNVRPNIDLDRYVHDRKYRNATNHENKKLRKKGNWRDSRKIVDRCIPVIFSLVWILLFLFYEIDTENHVMMLDKIRDLFFLIIHW